MDDIGKKIKDLRIEKRFTLKELAEKTGLSASFLSQVERSKSSITLQSLSKISDAFDVSRSYFFSDEDNETYGVFRSNLEHNLDFHKSSFVYQSLLGNIA